MDPDGERSRGAVEVSFKASATVQLVLSVHAEDEAEAREAVHEFVKWLAKKDESLAEEYNDEMELGENPAIEVWSL